MLCNALQQANITPNCQHDLTAQLLPFFTHATSSNIVAGRGWVAGAQYSHFRRTGEGSDARSSSQQWCHRHPHLCQAQAASAKDTV